MTSPTRAPITHLTLGCGEDEATPRSYSPAQSSSSLGCPPSPLRRGREPGRRPSGSERRRACGKVSVSSRWLQENWHLASGDMRRPVWPAQGIRCDSSPSLEAGQQPVRVAVSLWLVTLGCCGRDPCLPLFGGKKCLSSVQHSVGTQR